ncbi:tetratricopeptide repeat protein [Sporolactobacillus spathodeae]|uniref:Tetratricopeptide (TPR) repeat protein n=1 Tax=Sporolactobacillus spathodeae TaxID=1465502 RepID=A0ABS2Q613_9BACL|nr:tetratricopeptide repeat protein [Sporolactobacillus spathodeae]MBM7657203.1 tetratricopeptide (TPR) repeat protein [Sporolactobacillus spathodeae]
MNDIKHKERRVIPFRPTAEFFYQKGMNWYQRGDLERASKYLDRALKLKPNDVEYLCQQAAIFSELEYYESSIQLLKKVVYKIDSGMTECYFFMANNYAYLGEFEAALEAVQRYLTLEPNGAFADEASELFEMLTEETDEFIDLDESKYVRLHEKGRLALEHGRFDEAVRLFTRVTEDEPDFLAAQNNLTLAYFSLGRTNDALETAEKVLARDPGNIHTLCNLATYFEQMQQNDALRQVTDRLDRLYPMNPDHCGKLGSTYLYIGNDEKAAYWLNQAEQRGAHPDQVFRFWQALAAFHLGDEQGARRKWAQVDYFSNKPYHPFKYGKIQDMLYEKDAAENFMISDLIANELSENNRAYQLFSLFYLSGQGSWEQLDQLQIKGSCPMVRTVAGRLLAEKQSGSPDNGLEIVRYVEKYFGSQKEVLKRPEVYNFWYIIDSLLIRDRQTDCAGWAATLVYLWEKEYGQHCAQKSVAEATGTSVYRIRKHVHELMDALEQQQTEAEFE